jgi:hypothetical protein
MVFLTGDIIIIYISGTYTKKIMRQIVFLFVIVSIITVTGCTTAGSPAAPIGKGSLNLCIANPALADSSQIPEDILWRSPGDSGEKADQTIVAKIPACENLSATIWEKKVMRDTWSRITLRTTDGRSYTGWLIADHVTAATNETGTEWSEHYTTILGRWEQTNRGNGAKIWYEFKEDGTYTFNYDMMGNRDNVQDRGSWAYRGNGTYDLVSNTAPDNRQESITLDPKAKTFKSGFQHSSDPAAEHELVYARG